MITRRKFLVNSVNALFGVIPPLIGCADKNKHDSTYFRLDYSTCLGVSVQMPPWINAADFAKIGVIVDEYMQDFHTFLREQTSGGNLRLIIADRIKSFVTDSSYTGYAAGLYNPLEDLIICSWGKESNSNYPTRTNILPAFPHELSHRWLMNHNVSYEHDDFPKYVRDADIYAQQQSPEFFGEFSLYDPLLYYAMLPQ